MSVSVSVSVSVFRHVRSDTGWDGLVMTQSHCVSCPRLENLREGLDLDSMKDMVTYFRRILIERSKK